MTPLGWIARLLAALSRLVGPLAGFMWGRERTKRRQAEDSAKRAEKGRQGAAEAQDKLDEGKTPEQIVRENDGKWR